MIDWPADVHPVRSAFWFEPVTALSVAPLSRQELALSRDGARWRAEVTVELDGADAARFAAWLAACRGAVAVIRVPLWLRLGIAGSLMSMDAYAAAVGITRFTDGDFDDGAGFIEGQGRPLITGGVRSQLAVAGFAPWTWGVLAPGDGVRVPPGIAHWIVAAERTDIDGRMIAGIEPPLRTPVGRAHLETSDLTVPMRLVGADPGRGATRPPARTTWTLSLMEDRT